MRVAPMPALLAVILSAPMSQLGPHRSQLRAAETVPTTVCALYANPLRFSGRTISLRIDMVAGQVMTFSDCGAQPIGIQLEWAPGPQGVRDRSRISERLERLTTLSSRPGWYDSVIVVGRFEYSPCSAKGGGGKYGFGTGGRDPARIVVFKIGRIAATRLRR